MIRHVIALVTALTMLSGCMSMAPDYTRPDSPTSDNWPQVMAQGETQALSKTLASDMGWRVFLADQRLQNLIELALDNNRDLRIAALNIQRAKAQYRIQRSGLFPSVNATASETAQRLPSDLSSTGEATTSHQYNAVLGLTAYEIDFFGRIRSLKDQALEQFLATGEARRNAQISIVAEVSSAYLTLAANRERLRLARGTVESQQESFGLTKRSFELGVASELALRQAQTSVDAARVDVARYTGLVAVDENTLALLVGTPLSEELLATDWSDTAFSFPELPSGLPSEVLLNRPDVLEAEHRLQAANANIGATRAAFFPSITLTANAGTASASLSNLFGSGSGAWLFAPQVNLPIFNAGKNRANLRVAKADRDIAVAQYEKAIQKAFKEVADSLVQRSTLDDQMEAQRSLTNATKTSYRLADARYRSGVDSYLVVLVSERSFYSAQQNLISVQLARINNLVTLYKALGGGWLENTQVDKIR
jgi:outer membrane protein, multidrug efflux system